MCRNSGKTFVESLTTFPGGTPASADYLLSLDHYTCGNKKLCMRGEVFPVTASLSAVAVGAPVSVGNSGFCQEVLITGTVTYMPYTCGCQCDACPVTDNIYTTICVPCSSAATPTLTIGESAAAPTGARPCSDFTNCVAITTSLNVATA